MDNRVTGGTIRFLRNKKGLTQKQLADLINVSDKTVSKWETGKGFPDVSMIEPLSAALSASAIELLNGESVVNKNVSANVLRSRFYVCPVCGNVIYSVGEAVISCCGITLSPLKAIAPPENLAIKTDRIENELFVSVDHEMTKTHYISFMALIGYDGAEIKKLYPEGNAETRFRYGGGILNIFCNRHGLMKIKI